MALLQDLHIDQINEAVALAAERTVPVTVTVKSQQSWTNLRSRLLSVDEGHLLLEPPTESGEAPPREFSPGQKVGLSFKLKHYKHICTCVVTGTRRWALADGTEVPALSVCGPARMQRIQRRAYIRADVPANRIVRASFWLGGREHEPSGSTTESPVWSGRVTNLSAGGFQVHTADDVSDGLEIGETVGVRMIFGAGEQTIYADAQYRHQETDGDQFVLGFQFIGLDQTRQGRNTLKEISIKVSEFQREACRISPSA
jgi:c-di-GMP-binding flagellar brake protein YcgR